MLVQGPNPAAPDYEPVQAQGGGAGPSYVTAEDSRAARAAATPSLYEQALAGGTGTGGGAGGAGRPRAMQRGKKQRQGSSTSLSGFGGDDAEA